MALPAAEPPQTTGTMLVRPAVSTRVRHALSVISRRAYEPCPADEHCDRGFTGVASLASSRLTARSSQLPRARYRLSAALLIELAPVVDDAPLLADDMACPCRGVGLTPHRVCFG